MPLVAQISPDIVPFIFDAKIGLALILINGVDIANDVPSVESGYVRVEVLETFRPAEPRAGTRVSFAFSRDVDPTTRFLNRSNTWNALNLEPGARLLVAWAPVARSNNFSLVAALSVEAQGPPEVAELREAVVIQAMPPNNTTRVPRLANALVAGKSILRRYATAAVGPRELVPRAVGVAMLRDAIVSPRTGPDDDLALAGTLIEPPLFDTEKRDDEPNKIVLTTLAQSLIAADAEHSSLWLRYLYSRVMRQLSDDADENAVRRRELLRAIGVDREALSFKLRAMIGPGPDVELAAQLYTAWEGAHTN